jgi:hypothetical protein
MDGFRKKMNPKFDFLMAKDPNKEAYDKDKPKNLQCKKDDMSDPIKVMICKPYQGTEKYY